MELSSDSIPEDGQIPEKHSKSGGNLAPALHWRDVPSSARELAVLAEDVTGSGEPAAQWIVYKIPPEADHLPEGLQHKQDPEDPREALQGTNSLENVGYDGPVGSVGRKLRWRFRLFALDEPLLLDAGATREQLLKAAEGHIIGEAELSAVYERPRD